VWRLVEVWQDGCGGSQEFVVGADVDFVDAFAAVSYKFHGDTLADASCLEESGGGGVWLGAFCRCGGEMCWILC